VLPPQFVDKMYDDYDRETRRTVLKLYRQHARPGRPHAGGRRGARAAEQAGARDLGRERPVLERRLREGQRDYFDVEQVALLP